MVTTNTFQLQAGRVLAEDVNKKLTSANNGGIKMPSLTALVGNSSVNFLDQTVNKP